MFKSRKFETGLGRHSVLVIGVASFGFVSDFPDDTGQPASAFGGLVGFRALNLP